MSPSSGDALSGQFALSPAPQLFRDRQFWLAVVLPVFFWIGLYQLLAPRDIAHPPLFWLNQVLLIPIVEELVFRGWLQGSLLRRRAMRNGYCGISLANFAAALLFSAAHFFSHPPIWAAGVIVPALVFGYFRERHNSVYPAILLHVYYNGGYFAFLE